MLPSSYGSTTYAKKNNDYTRARITNKDRSFERSEQRSYPIVGQARHYNLTLI